MYLVKLIKPKKLFSKEQTLTRVLDNLGDAVACVNEREKGFDASIYIERIYGDKTETTLLWSSADSDETALRELLNSH